MILRLPEAASAKLPSRGQVAVRSTINRYQFETVLEPDGRRGHWMRLDEELQRAARIAAGGTATVEQDLWQDITPMARWEWVRWVNATANADTRRRRVEVTISKMSSGKRRPCCFDFSSCTDPNLSKNGRLLA